MAQARGSGVCFLQHESTWPLYSVHHLVLTLSVRQVVGWPATSILLSRWFSLPHFSISLQSWLVSGCWEVRCMWWRRVMCVLAVLRCVQCTVVHLSLFSLSE